VADIGDPIGLERTAQVVLRWHVDHGFVVIPKSSNPARIAANFDVIGFTLNAAEVARVDALGV
jgi:2,5-diketo-D-gluconate reductase A